MPLIRWFRILLISEVIIGILAAVVGNLTEGQLPEPLRLLLETEAAAAGTRDQTVLLMISLPLLFLSLGSIIGLYFFWRPARVMYVTAALLIVAVNAFTGPTVDAGYGESLDELSTLMAGAVIALAWFSPLAGVFDRKLRNPGAAAPPAGSSTR